MMALAHTQARRSAGSALVGLVTCAVLLSSCSTGSGSGAARTTPETASSATGSSSAPRVGHRLEFVVPSGWEEMDDPSGAAPSLAEAEEIESPHVVVGPKEDDGNPHVIITTTRSTQSLDEFTRDVWSGFPAVQATEAQPVAVAGQAAARSTAKGTLNGVDITSVTVIVDDGDRRHMLTLTTPTSTAARATAAYDSLLESVSLT